MAGKRKDPFAALPIRALWDPELTALELRVLGVVCWHDRLSKQRESAGCYAANLLMAAEAGCTITSLSRALTKLAKRGYIERDHRGVPGKRHLTVYRVQYDPADLETIAQRGKDYLPNETNDEPETFAREDRDWSKSFARRDSGNGRNPPRFDAQETSLREERDSVETGERNSSEDARFAARGSARGDFGLPVGARLAMLDRALKSGEKFDCLSVYAWLHSVEDDEHRYWALRLAESVVDAMDDDEYRAWREEHGWVDDEGKWHAPHPRAQEVGPNTPPPFKSEGSD